jgi:hypothetical protein
MKLIITLLLCLQMMGPAIAQTPPKTPLQYSLSEYGLMLSVALLGGLVSWFAKVRSGEIGKFSLTHLIGELATSAFAGLLAFWICEWGGFPQLLTAAIVGISGHAGTAAIQNLEKMAERRLQAVTGVAPEVDEK